VVASGPSAIRSADRNGAALLIAFGKDVGPLEGRCDKSSLCSIMPAGEPLWPFREPEVCSEVRRLLCSDDAAAVASYILSGWCGKKAKAAVSLGARPAGGRFAASIASSPRRKSEEAADPVVDQLGILWLEHIHLIVGSKDRYQGVFSFVKTFWV
jgi:hypothetical protein